MPRRPFYAATEPVFPDNFSAQKYPITKTGLASPADVNGLQLWLRSDPISGLFTDAALTTAAADTDEVLGWEDQSGNGRHVTDAAAGPHLADTALPAQPNGRATLDFVAATVEKLAAAAAAPYKFLHDGSGCTGFVAYKQTDENIGVLLDTGGYGGASGTGVMLYGDDSSTTEGRLALVVQKGTGTPIVNLLAGATVNGYPAGAWHIARFSYIEGGAPTEAQLFGDGCFHVGANSGAAPSASDPSGPLTIGLDIDGVLTNALAFDGSIAEVILFNRVLAQAESRQIENYLSVRWGVAVGNVALLGDSIIAGSAVTRIPATVVANRLGPMWRATNFGVSGARIDNGGTDVNDAQWLHTTAGARRRGYNFIVVAAGINDVRNDQSAATNLAELETIYNSVLADPNNRLVCCTLTPFKGDSAYNADREVERLATNVGIRRYAVEHGVGVVDLATLLADPADAAAMHPLLTLDNLHPNQAGSDLMATAIADKLLGVGLD